MLRTPLAFALLGLMTAGCSCDDPAGVDGGGVDGDVADAGNMDAGGDGTDAGPDSFDAGPTVVILDGGDILLPDGRVIPRGPITCQGHLYACGDTLDNDGDGLTDDRDPDCLGPCDNNEEGFDLNIPGGDSAPCRLDCYFDQDQGPGNDGCNWDHRCDPLEPDPVCDFSDPPPASARCPETQQDICEETCAPLVPNGCDCFGCCNLPAGGERWVFIGSVDGAGVPTCNLEDQESDEACHPCTPVQNCLNECGECELCLGRPELPPSCFPDAGPPVDAGPPNDAGPLPDGALPDAGPPPPPRMCDDGRPACGVPGDPPCAAGEFCLTGCCTFFG